MTDAPLFTVIVSTYDRPTYLAEALDSIKRQTVTDWECLVVHDAGPGRIDLPDDSRFRLVRRERNGGAAAARNTGVAGARGRFVTFLDDDDLFTPDRLEMAIEGAGRAPVAICWSRFLDGPARAGRRLEGYVSGTLHEGLVPNVGATTVRRDASLPFDENYRSAEDVEWWIRLVEVASVATVPRIGHLIRRHPGVRHRNDLAIRARENIRLMELHPRYFSDYPRAAAFRWSRVGHLARTVGDHRLARMAFARSLRIRPQAAAGWHLVRSLRPSTGSVGLVREAVAA